MPAPYRGLTPQEKQQFGSVLSELGTMLVGRAPGEPGGPVFGLAELIPGGGVAARGAVKIAKKAPAFAKAVGQVGPEALNQAYTRITQMARSFSKSNRSLYDDLVNEGVEAVMKLTGRSGIKSEDFPRLATRHAATAMKDLARRTTGPVQMPRTAYQELNKIRAYEQSYMARRGESPPDELIAIKFKMPLQKVRTLRAERATEAGLPLETPTGKLEQVVEQLRAPGPAQEMDPAMATKLEQIQETLKGLTEQQRKFAELVYGQGVSAGEAARQLGFSKQRASTIDKALKSRMRRLIGVGEGAAESIGPAARTMPGRAVTQTPEQVLEAEGFKPKAWTSRTGEPGSRELLWYDYMIGDAPTTGVIKAGEITPERLRRERIEIRKRFGLKSE